MTSKVPEGDVPPDDPLFAEAAAALDEGDLERATAAARRGARQARRDGDDDRLADFLWLEGAALTEGGEPLEALDRLDEALRRCPDHLDAMLERAWALFELCRFDEAARQLDEVEAREPDDAWGHHLRGLLAERRGDEREAERRFARARRLDPQGFPRPVSVPPAEFERLAEEALAALPEPVRRYLANVPVMVEPLPSLDDLAGAHPPLSPTILGIFRGAPYGQKASADPWSHLPSSIVLYQRNLERFAADRDELVEQIGVTLLHEVGHFLGLDEAELAARGLD
jgi:predicted Zn-dependent protease with MMP-like domain